MDFCVTPQNNTEPVGEVAASLTASYGIDSVFGVFCKKAATSSVVIPDGKNIVRASSCRAANPCSNAPVFSLVSL